MMNGCSILAIIPARGGSKGVPMKNIRMFHGQPLLAWTIQAAQGCREIDRLLLSSDDERIMEVARHYGCEVPFARPPELATDTATSLDVARHVLDHLEKKYDILLWLQPTSPLRTSDHIRAALEVVAQGRHNSCVSVCRSAKPPEWMFRLQDDHTLIRVVPQAQEAGYRQAIPPAYVLNGAIYACSIPWLLQGKSFTDNQTIALVMEDRHSIDIDTEQDFQLGEWWMRHNLHLVVPDRD